MGKPISLTLLFVLVLLTTTLLFTNQMQSIVAWMEILNLRFAFNLFVVYLFLYWIVIEVKNSYLEWKYLEES